ncbi:ATP synthase F1 subunit gamma [bacterium]|nr:ATP synthase F1 subunit gamma [bacterium]
MKQKEIKRKISSIGNIFEITKAIEVISAIKMKKAQELALNSRPFTQTALKILKNLSRYEEEIQKRSIFFKEGKGNVILAVVVTSDKGFCGAYNRNILGFFEREIKEEREIEIMAIGKKAIKYFRKKDYKVLIEFSGIGDYGELEEIKPIADLLIRYFKQGRFRKILFFYPDFISTFYQKPTKIQILPLKLREIEEMLRNYQLRQKRRSDSETEEKKERTIDYILEPSFELIFESLVPQLVEFLIYHLILEANASEHSARMMAMKSASENIERIMENLKLEENKARQAQITSEVTEITTAKEALQ